jgi:hypothetical protein
VSPKIAVKCRIDSLLLRYGIYDRLQSQPDASRQYLAEPVNQFMNAKPSRQEFEALEMILHEGLIRAAKATGIDVRKYLLQSGLIDQVEQ